MQLRTPLGVKDFPPTEARKLIALEQRIRQELDLWGYGEVITPTYEFAQTFEVGGASTEQAYRFFDRDGQLLTLRSDLTTPIARMVATRYEGHTKPLRFSYLANVFRYRDVQIGWQREFYQAGVELFGSNHSIADGEIIALACKLAEVAGINDFRLDIGHVQFFKGLMEEVGCQKTAKLIRNALLKQDFVQLGSIVRGAELDKDKAEFLLELPNLRGGKEIITYAQDKTRNPLALSALDNLSDVLDTVHDFGFSHSVNVDLGLLKSLDYYSAIVLEGYTTELGFNLCTGGRYDGLCERFGSPCPATGFAFGMERILLALDKQGSNGDAPKDTVLVIGDRRQDVYQLAERLRSQGFTTELNVQGFSDSEATAYAKERQLKRVVAVKQGKVKEVWSC